MYFENETCGFELSLPPHFRRKFFNVSNNHHPARQYRKFATILIPKITTRHLNKSSYLQ